MFRLLSGLLAGLLASLAVAQDDAVVITATRFPDSKRDLPVGVTVITADDISRSGSSNLGDILAQYGLLHIRNLSGSQNLQVDLRGFGATGDQNTLVLLDGIRISENELVPAQLSAIPVDSIERIEIVRGGGSVQYGGGATGGTVNIITRRTRPGESRARVLARAGGYGTGEARATLERSGGSLGVALAGSYEDTEGYRDNSHYRQGNFAGRLDARLGTARLYAKLALDDQQQRLPGSLSEAEIEADRRQSTRPGDFTQREGVHLAFGGTQYLGRHELSADASYRTKDSRFVQVFGGVAFPGDTDVDEWSLSPRVKLAFDALGRAHELIVGADFQAWHYDSRSPFLVDRLSSEQSNAAVYGQLGAWLTESTRLVLGARRQHVGERLQIVQRDTEGHSLEAYEAALRQRFARGWSAYAKYSKSFRVATFDENACFALPCSGLLEPQSGKGAELGIEYESRRLRARGSIYRTDLENEIYFSPLVPPFGANVNLSPTRRRGLELEAAWRAAETIDLRAGLALLEAKFRSGTFGGVDVSGSEIPLVPEVLASAGISWTYAPRSRASLNARYVGEQRFDNDQANRFRKQPAYGVVDLKIEHALSRAWQVALEVRNLLNERYFSYGRVNDATAPTTFDALPEPERAAYLSVAWTME
ncbi:MAG TPA: TonB-dependent receptor [Burkholderiales bacterium]